MILMLTQDLMMSSTVSSIAKTIDEPVKTASSVTAAQKQIDVSQPRLLLIDLQTPALKLDDVGTMLRAIAQEQRPRTVAYAQHVNKELLEQATEIGFDQVLTRGQMHGNAADVLGA